MTLKSVTLSPQIDVMRLVGQTGDQEENFTFLSEDGGDGIKRWQQET